MEKNDDIAIYQLYRLLNITYKTQVYNIRFWNMAAIVVCAVAASTYPIAALIFGILNITSLVVTWKNIKLNKVILQTGINLYGNKAINQTIVLMKDIVDKDPQPGDKELLDILKRIETEKKSDIIKPDSKT